MKIRDTANKIVDRMAFAIDQNNRDADFDSAFVEDGYLYFSNIRGEVEWNLVIPLANDYEFKNGLLETTDINGDLCSIMIYEHKPLTLE
jgi:hypothetical protein